MMPLVVAVGVLFVFVAVYFFFAPEDWSFKKRLKKYALHNTELREEEENRPKRKSVSVIAQNQSNSSDFVFKSFGADPHSLRAKLLQAGLKITVLEFFVYQSLIIVIFSAVGILAGGVNIISSTVVGILLGIVLSRMWLNSKITQRVDAFNRIFPDAIDMMLSVTKSGLPLINALQSVAESSADPVKSEFKRICSEVSLGVQLADAVGKSTERVPSQEMSFFAISLSIQLETGGSLTDVFNNLSKILRNRQDL